MDKDSSQGPVEEGLFAGEAWFDPIEAGLRGRIRGLIEELVEQELEAALGRGRYERGGMDQTEYMIQPDGVADNLGREAVTWVGGEVGQHPASLAQPLRSGQ
jgi:hypothetical protein